MNKKIKFELFETEKLVKDFAYVINMSPEEKSEINAYRAELVALLNSSDAELKLSIPSRPSWVDKYC